MHLLRMPIVFILFAANHIVARGVKPRFGNEGTSKGSVMRNLPVRGVAVTSFVIGRHLELVRSRDGRLCAASLSEKPCFCPAMAPGSRSSTIEFGS